MSFGRFFALLMVIVVVSPASQHSEQLSKQFQELNEYSKYPVQVLTKYSKYQVKSIPRIDRPLASSPRDNHPSKQEKIVHSRSKQSGIKRVQVVPTVWWSPYLKPSSAESSPQSSCYSHAPAKTSANKYSFLNDVQTSVYKQLSY